MSDPKKRSIDDFVKKPDDDVIENDWTEEEVIAAGRKIMKEMGIDGKISDPNS